MIWTYLGNKSRCIDCIKRNPSKWHCDPCDQNYTEVKYCPAGKFDNNKDCFPVLLLDNDPERFTSSYYVPFGMVGEHLDQCLRNHGQSATQLKARGGLSWMELYAVLTDQSFERASEEMLGDNKLAKNAVIELAEKWGLKEKEFIVPVEWAMCGFIKVKAKTAEEAIKKIADDTDAANVQLPDGNGAASYIDGSFAVSGYEDEEETAYMCRSFTEDYEKGKQFRTLN